MVSKSGKGKLLSNTELNSKDQLCVFTLRSDKTFEYDVAKDEEVQKERKDDEKLEKEGNSRRLIPILSISDNEDNVIFKWKNGVKEE
ncbi:hypothetical protein K2173_025282 [Erythroxylum novogranatense]|uniref:Uncharacterized protein n=1 Tax=Erythroxylum novogranatense TaxID=1862640 RepID=A0AAV8UDD9_9ROSI|nr:hypothetical protein K2173_025282 [Erythroxylum novogranatense]